MNASFHTTAGSHAVPAARVANLEDYVLVRYLERKDDVFLLDLVENCCGPHVTRSESIRHLVNLATTVLDRRGVETFNDDFGG